jgi:hypothetical protein
MRIRNFLFAGHAPGARLPALSAAAIQYHVSFGAGNFIRQPAGQPSRPLLVISAAFDVDLDVGASVTTTNTSGLHNTSISAFADDAQRQSIPLPGRFTWSFIYDAATDI